MESHIDNTNYKTVAMNKKNSEIIAKKTAVFLKQGGIIQKIGNNIVAGKKDIVWETRGSKS